MGNYWCISTYILLQGMIALGLDQASKDFLLAEYLRLPRATSHSICAGRLTLTSGTAVTTSDVTGATTVYFTPFDGHQIALYDGASNWDLLEFTEISVAVPSNTTTPFDIFAYNNAGSVTLETTAWTNDTTRATALTTQDGVYVRNAATTRRYLGTGRTTGVSGQTEDSVTKRFLWNNYHRVSRTLLVTESTDSWSYDTATWRSANNSTANRIEVVVGLAEIPVRLKLHGSGRPELTEEYSIGIAQDSTSSHHSYCLGMYGGLNTEADYSAHASLNVFPSIGYHYYQWIEISTQGGASTFYGDTKGLSGIGGTIEG